MLARTTRMFNYNSMHSKQLVAQNAKNKIFIDKISGVRTERPGLDKCMGELEAGDTLLVWRLDRLGRSMAHLVALVEDLGKKGIGFRSLCDGAIDTTTASGELIFKREFCLRNN